MLPLTTAWRRKLQQDTRLCTYRQAKEPSRWSIPHFCQEADATQEAAASIILTGALVNIGQQTLVMH